jgi:hypothetical protein
MDTRTNTTHIPGLSAHDVQALQSDANAAALIKAYLAIPDESVKKKLRRLAEEIASTTKRLTKAAN